jgi:hypothetical protein
MEQLQMSFTKKDPKKPFQELETFVPSLIRDKNPPPNLESLWPRAALPSFSVEKCLVYYFDLLPQDFIRRLLALLLQKFSGIEPNVLWQSGIVLPCSLFQLLVRLEPQPHEYKIIVKGQSLKISKEPSSPSSKTQLLVVHVRATSEEHGLQEIQKVVQLVNKIKESYIGIRFWQLARECPLHGDVEGCVGFVDMTKEQPVCISINAPIAFSTVAQLRIKCGLKALDGLVFPSVFSFSIMAEGPVQNAEMSTDGKFMFLKHWLNVDLISTRFSFESKPLPISMTARKILQDIKLSRA